ncbi:MAG: MBL fold metallo-hydrolase [Treponema sp.]|nr:MBL fold metallo-hydrolase [Treponema sp.]
MKRSILFGILLSAVMIPCFSQEQANPQVFTYKLGKAEVSTLVEVTRPGGIPTILSGVSQDLLDQYFPDGTSQSQTNAFLVRSGKQIVLIDTGFGINLFDNLKSLGVTPDMVQAVLMTHLHPDHIGGLAKDGKAMFPKAIVYVSAAERDYWTKTNVNQQVVDALKAYGSRVKTFVPAALGAKSKEVVPGITPVAAPGHTPGHTVYLVNSDGQKLLIAGDFMHVEKIQWARPDISVTYDSDPVLAAQTRMSIINYVCANNIPIAGMHLLYPSIGTVSADGDGFVFTPAK